MSKVTDKYLSEQALGSWAPGSKSVFDKNSVKLARKVTEAVGKLVSCLEDAGDSRSKEVDRLGMKIVTIMSKKQRASLRIGKGIK